MSIKPESKFKTKLTFISSIIPIMILSFSYSSIVNAALSATTAKTIEGTKPYLASTHVTAINAGNDFSLLGVKFDSNSYFTASDISTKLASLGGASVGALSPTSLAKELGDGATGAMSAGYKKPTVVTDADDSDGDGFTATSLTGSATTGWYYSNSGTETALSSADLSKTFCALATQGISPYIKISGPVTLSTEYGDPNSQVYDIANAASPISGGTNNPVRRFYPNGGAMVCFASPNLTYASGNYNPNESDKFDPTYGFLLQTNAADNFPRTGSNKLYFYLIVTGMNAGSATWSVTKSPSTSNITATVAKNTPALGTSGFVTYNGNTMVLVTLSGPDVAKNASTGIPTTNSAPAAQTSTSAVNITITGTDGTNTVNYPFSIQTWFINGGKQIGTASAQTAWCSGLSGTNYRIIQVKDVTNASGTAAGNGGTIPSVSNPSSGNWYQRRTTGGLFSEWGNLGSYTGSDWLSSRYWTSDSTGALQFRVVSDYGYVVSSAASSGLYGACRSQ